MKSAGKKIKKYFSKSLIGKISDQEYDKLIDQLTKPLHNRALAKTLLDSRDRVRPPVGFKGPILSLFGITASRVGGAEFNYKKGRDGYIRYTPIGITIINFTQHEIIAYQCVFDPITGNALNESTCSYFYQDVISLETRTESKAKEEISNGKKIFRKIPLIKKLIGKGNVKQYDVSEKFILTTSGSSVLEVKLSENELVEKVGGKFSTSESEYAIRSVRQMLRDKKK